MHFFEVNLNPQQEKAATHGRGPALVLAGPGSGKTTVITVRTAFLIRELGVSPANILTLTFNRAAKLEMEQRFRRFSGSEIGYQVQFSTLHSFGNQVVRDYENLKGKRLKRIEGDEQAVENKRNILRKLYRELNGTNPGDEELENLSNEIGLVKNKMLTSLSGINFSTPNFEGLYRAYEEYKKSNFYMDFDDMLTYAYAILKRYPDILNFYRNQYPYIQVDEGQDLSKIQFEILKLLIQPGNNLFIVADDDQSIYGFRGAEPGYILEMERQLPGCRIYKLEQNYRSSRNIVEISSQFIKANQNRYDKQHRTDNASKADPFIIKVKDELEQLRLIIKTVKEKWQQYPDSSIAILYRNNLSSLLLVDGLEREGIGFKLKQNKLFFFKHWVIQDLLAFMRFALDQTDGDAFRRIGHKMKRYLSRDLIELALTAKTGKNVLEILLTSERLAAYQRKVIADLKGEFQRLARSRPVAALEYIEKSFKYFELLKNYCQSQNLNYDYYYSLYGELKNLAGNYPSLAAFLERMTRLEQIFEQGQVRMGAQQQLTLSTIHSAKGLEYDCVLMVDLCNPEIPGQRAMDLAIKNGDNFLLEEERRLFYVGMTRAREYLYLITPLRKNGAVVPPSLFVEEVLTCIDREFASHNMHGAVVYHNKFGKGIVVEVKENDNGRTVIIVEFSGVRRKLDLGICLENGVLHFGEVSSSFRKLYYN
ncbi:ATP-dependent helicase [Carboxydocella thermautotrophica]|uniref:DNA 3'-5' helicase n=1 Tax=Carboxydocella thermautotrophica TaxID=178899 RepID=A0A2R4MXW7_CARTR|nr:ATP-dependent helicase [Carboxydocella thermautotrophica]AVX19639.1 DNA helicase-2 / ATP-dependent DNA helicase PcrA [Carboxydocella thermautotrophica]AVX30046.1 DNA helicase-2 / ATP-dependent DNA helicase PcrA [Carboxydocella thermautotrophica]